MSNLSKSAIAHYNFQPDSMRKVINIFITLHISLEIKSSEIYIVSYFI